MLDSQYRVLVSNLSIFRTHPNIYDGAFLQKLLISCGCYNCTIPNIKNYSITVEQPSSHLSISMFKMKNNLQERNQNAQLQIFIQANNTVWKNLSHIPYNHETWHIYTLPKEDPRNIWIIWHISWVLLTSAIFNWKSANFGTSENTDIDCILVHNF